MWERAIRHVPFVVWILFFCFDLVIPDFILEFGFQFDSES